jgi:hypothetical protein
MNLCARYIKLLYLLDNGILTKYQASTSLGLSNAKKKQFAELSYKTTLKDQIHLKRAQNQFHKDRKYEIFY